MKQVFEEKRHCCGCGACANICPVKAIDMQGDEEGFLYPKIDEDACVDCGKCVEICPFFAENNYKNTTLPLYYVAKHISEEVLMHSASGGAFTALSDAVLAEKGVVYGADFDEHFKVVHRRAVNSEERDRLRTSKYVQSDITYIYASVEEDLRQNKMVLFTGTPCQNAGLKGYVQSKNLEENLYLCDLLCHSVPSPLIWSEFLKILTKTYGAIAAINFRSKNMPWSRPNCKKAFYLKTVLGSHHADNRFLRLFLEEQTIARPSCEACLFTDEKRTGDITIGDYWGIEKYDAARYDALGVSLILTNTAKGEQLLQGLAGELRYERRDSKEALAEQQRLRTAIKFPPQREQFWLLYQKHGLEYLLEKTESK